MKDGCPESLSIPDAIIRAMPNSDGMELAGFYTALKSVSLPLSSGSRVLNIGSITDFCSAFKIGRERFYKLMDALWNMGIVDVEKEKLEHGWRNKYVIHTELPYPGPIRTVRQGSFRYSKSTT
jgi:hypothetical protein